MPKDSLSQTIKNEHNAGISPYRESQSVDDKYSPLQQSLIKVIRSEADEQMGLAISEIARSVGFSEEKVREELENLVEDGVLYTVNGNLIFILK